MKKKLLVISNLLLVIGLFVSSPTWGQSPTPTPNEKVKGIREAVKEKVQEKLAEAGKGQKRAFVGEITDITNTTLVLDTHQGEKHARAGEETIIISREKEEIEFEDLEIGSFAIAMGYLEETGLLDARRIVISKKPKVPTRLVAFGEVTDKSSEEKILTVKHPKKGTVWSVEAISRTKITKKIEGEMERIGFDEIAKNDRLVAIGTPAEGNNFLTAKIIHVIPGRAVGLESPSPTPSPTATPTPAQIPDL